MHARGDVGSEAREIRSTDGGDLPEENKVCAFCGNIAPDGVALIAGPHASICGTCVEVCMGIVEDHRKRTRGNGSV